MAASQKSWRLVERIIAAAANEPEASEHGGKTNWCM